MRFRHRLIRMLACGDLIFLNAEVMNDGTLRSRNAGSMLIANLFVRSWTKPWGIAVGPASTSPSAALSVEPTGSQGLLMADIEIDLTHPLRQPVRRGDMTLLEAIR